MLILGKVENYKIVLPHPYNMGISILVIFWTNWIQSCILYQDSGAWYLLIAWQKTRVCSFGSLEIVKSQPLIDYIFTVTQSKLFNHITEISNKPNAHTKCIRTHDNRTSRSIDPITTMTSLTLLYTQRWGKQWPLYNNKNNLRYTIMDQMDNNGAAALVQKSTPHYTHCTTKVH